MFYSQLLISKKGHLGPIWIAAFCFKRLKKQHVAETDIPSSVDKILVHEVPSVTYRLLAYLLLGVVRIYSKKVEYLFHDCHNIITDMNKHFGKQIISPLKQKRDPQFSIRVPKRFELDTFVLEQADLASRAHVVENEDIALLETWIDDELAEVSLGKYEAGDARLSAETTTVQNEACLSSPTPVELPAEQGNNSSCHTPPDEVFSPTQLQHHTEVTSPYNEWNLGDSMEKLRDIRFSHEECVDFEMFCQADIADPNVNISSSVPDADTELGDLIEKIISEGHDAVELKNVKSASHAHDAGKLNEMGSSWDITHGSEVGDARCAQGGVTPRSLAIQTPANIDREPVKRGAKRKCIDDRVIALSNRTMKRNIDDASDLVCRRRKAPCTLLDIWRFYHIPDLGQNFLRPIVPCVVVEHIESFHRKKPKVAEPLESAQTPSTPEVILSSKSLDVRLEITPDTPVLNPMPKSPDGRLEIAPGTPVLHSIANRLLRGPNTIDSDGEGPSNSYEGARHKVSTDEVTSLELDMLETNLMEEEPEENEGDGQEPYVWTAKTRAVARYLYRSIMHLKQQKRVEAVSLSQLLGSRRKRESARVFYEILVLKSGGFVDVKQKRPYEDIIIRRTDRMEETLGDC